MIVYIHGASATSQSFNYIKPYIKNSLNLVDICFDYKSSDGFYNNLKTMQDKLVNEDQLFFVGHSLGGIYALHLANIFSDKTIGGVTLSTPYGGCSTADFAKYFLPFSQLLKDVGTMSVPIREINTIPTIKNWTNIVSTSGHCPWINGKNDGVVTIKSMKDRTDFELIELPINHYEVVLNEHVVNIIIDKIKNSI